MSYWNFPFFLSIAQVTNITDSNIITAVVGIAVDNIKVKESDAVDVVDIGAIVDVVGIFDVEVIVDIVY